MPASLFIFIDGLLLGGALIIAIGAQNMFVLRQGVAHNQVFIVCLLSSLIDASLILAGALGLGTVINLFPALITYVTLGGILFLVIVGGMSFWRAYRPQPVNMGDGRPLTSSAKKAAMMTLAFGLLNPHVYLDTVIMLGSIASTYELTSRYYFVGGAVFMSFFWFFALGYGAKVMSPLLARPAAARTLDFLVGTMMYVVAYNLWGRL